MYDIQLCFKCIQLCNPRDCSLSGSSVHGDSPGKNTKVGCHAHLQGICPTQGSNLGLPHCRWILYHLSHQESPRILECVAYPFFSGSSLPRSQTRVSCISDGALPALPAELSGKPFACSECGLIPYLKPTISFLPQINFEKTFVTFVGKLYIQ